MTVQEPPSSWADIVEHPSERKNSREGKQQSAGKSSTASSTNSSEQNSPRDQATGQKAGAGEGVVEHEEQLQAGTVANRSQPQQRPFYKTRLCVRYAKDNHCDYGDACSYAHGLEELRSLDDNNQKYHRENNNTQSNNRPGGNYQGENRREYHRKPGYRRTSLQDAPVHYKKQGPSQFAKTKLCAKFTKFGRCNLRDECTFAHGQEELRVLEDNGVEEVPPTKQNQPNTTSSQPVETPIAFLPAFREVLMAIESCSTATLDTFSHLAFEALENRLSLPAFIENILNASFSISEPLKAISTNKVILRQIANRDAPKLLSGLQKALGEYEVDEKTHAAVFRMVYREDIVGESVMLNWIQSLDSAVTLGYDSLQKLGAWLESVQQ